MGEHSVLMLIQSKEISLTLASERCGCVRCLVKLHTMINGKIFAIFVVAI